MPLDSSFCVFFEIAYWFSPCWLPRGKLEGLKPLDGSCRISLEIAHHFLVFEGPLKVTEYANREVLPDGRYALGEFLLHLVGDSILVQPLLAP